ncbi:MAG: rRNA maturation RNase YbeY [Bacteroidota bacterium]|nr:rRNA maturation RNase YbeY [Bacteroidota bacterium]
MSSKSKVYFFFDKITVSLKNRKILKRYIELIFQKEGKKLDCLNYIFCSDARLRQINKDYLKHDYYTDIITFDLSEPGSPVSADIYISVERVKENAEKLGISFNNEVHRVLFHGVLHLCGFGDKNEREVKRIREKEDFYLVGYFK